MHQQNPCTVIDRTIPIGGASYLSMINRSAFILLIFIWFKVPVLAQVQLAGSVIDSDDRKTLAYVNIGIKKKNIGTTSLKDGTFTIDIPSEHLLDTLTFSMVGYYELDIPIKAINSQKNFVIRLMQKITELNEIVISGEKLVEKKYGIRKRGLIHFTDGVFKGNSSFEIGQLVNLGNRLAQVTSLNLYIVARRSDSASFRINFYKYDENDNRPAERIIDKNIIQRHPIHQGWLKFDLSKCNIVLKGKVFVSLEFIPEKKQDIKQIFYEIKIGGASKSFFRRNAFGQWVTPPHHYCMYITASVDKSAPEVADDTESIPSITLKPDSTKEFFNIFVRLPKDYDKNPTKKYPVIYHLDGNAFFDPISSSVDRLIRKKKISSDLIVVGIGYENAYVMDSLRDRDYTYPRALPSDSFRTSGGAQNFYRFIKINLEPYIDKTYRTDTANRTIMGHSLGGYFVLYALLQDIKSTALFNNYVAASPSTWYFNNYILKEFQALYDQGITHKNLKLYLTIGELEMSPVADNNFRQVQNILSVQKFIQLKVNVYKNTEHMGTALPSFEDGVEFILLK